MLKGYSMNATVAKIRAIHGKMFTAAQYHELLLKGSVSECAEYLAQSPRYKDVFRDTDPNTIHRGYLEELLHQQMYDTYVRICEFQQLAQVPYYRFLIGRGEIDSILLMINNINSGLENSFLANLPGHMIKRARINVLEMSRAESFDELLSVLKGTIYYKPLSKVRVDASGKAEYTDCELALRKSYFETLLEYVDKDFNGSEQKEIEDIIYFEIDTMNIINAYRMKKYFGYSSERIKQSIITISGKPVGKLAEYFEIEDPDQMMAWISRSRYGKSHRETDIIETIIASSRYQWLNHVLASTVSAPVALYAFMRLCAVEISNIVSIIEAVRYGADAAAVEKDMLIF